jgi:hypothetical protein
MLPGTVDWQSDCCSMLKLISTIQKRDGTVLVKEVTARSSKAAKKLVRKLERRGDVRLIKSAR